MAKMMSMPFRFGLPNDRWTKCIDVMLEKKLGVRQIHQLRLIGLLEEDFNTAFKIYFAKMMISNSELADLTEEQWGGRPGRTATDPAMRKLLAFEYGRAIYVTIALFANDAKACYDRMVPDISTIIARKFGVAPSIMKARNVVMEAMEHHVKTQHGISSTGYKQTSGEPEMAGETQGKADPACLWNVESQTLLRTHQQIHDGIRLRSADGTRQIRKNNDAFVDDCDGVSSRVNDSFRESKEQTREHFRTGAQKWSQLITATGGHNRIPQMRMDDVRI